MIARIDHQSMTIVRGRGYRKYVIKYFCAICKRKTAAIYVPGWGNVLRCEVCCVKVGKRCNILFGTPFSHYLGNRLLKHGFEYARIA